MPLVFPTSVEFIDAFFGVLLAGAVPAPLYPPVHLGRLAEYRERTVVMVRAVDARLVLADRRVQSVLGEVINRARPPLGCISVSELPMSAPADPAFISASDLALVQFSSGTTREPRPVALSHRALVAQVSLLNRYWPDSERVRHSGVSWLPLYHDMGLIGSLLVALDRPGTLTLIPPELFVKRPAIWLQAISKYRATISPAPSFAYGFAASRIQDQEMDGVDLSSWRVALVGAEVVVPDVMRRFARRFESWGFRPEALTPGYGLAEASLAVTLSDPTRLFVSRHFDSASLSERATAVEVDGGAVREAGACQARELASSGSPLPGFEVRVVDEDGRELPEGGLGLIECRGPSLMEGYLGQPEATASCLRHGWLSTGDLGFFWKGELFLAGRAKDVLIIRGRNYAPEEVEQALDAVAGARPGCAVAVGWLPEGEGSECLLVIVEARREVAAGAFADLSKACSERVLTVTGLRAERVVVVAPGTLPRTSSGKLRRQEALRRYIAGELRPPRAVTPVNIASAVVRSSLARLRSRWWRLRP